MRELNLVDAQTCLERLLIPLKARLRLQALLALAPHVTSTNWKALCWGQALRPGWEKPPCEP